ncbi:MAG: condensation domain-containing protein, partial [Pyrinomonadaceae bacterium]
MTEANAENSYGLSPLQQGLLFHSLYSRQTGVDIEQVVGDLREQLNAPAFEGAWRCVLERHAVLRTSFLWEGLAEPLQVVNEGVSLPLEAHDWRGLPAAEQETRLAAYLKADRRRDFDLSSPPLMRLALIRLGETRYKLVWSCHHLLIDGRTLVLVLGDLFKFYEAIRRGEDLRLKGPRPYRDYIEWLEGQDLGRAEAFWREELRGFAAPTPLVAAAPHKAHATSPEDGRGEQQAKLSADVTAALGSLSREHYLTLNTIVQGAWALLLSRYSREDDVVFGAIREGRRSTVKGAGEIAGLFINTLPARARVSGDAPLVAWLRELQERQAAVREFEHTPLAKVQNWGDVPRGTPLFETILNFQNPPWSSVLEAQGGNWANRKFAVHSQTNYPLSMDVYAGPELSLKVEYDRTRFDDATVARLLGHYRTLLEGMAASPDGRLSDLSLLTTAERHQLLVEWNDTAVEFPEQSCVHQLFERQVERTPEAMAAAFGDERLTYRKLNRRANRLAHHLRKLGVGPDTAVGILAERSLGMVVGVLGTLKAGGAYVPLDAAYPKERLSFMLEDAGVTVLLTEERLTGKLPDHGARVVLLDAELFAAESEENLSGGATAESLAYVIYTSGSTGKPKGVPISHRALTSHSTVIARHYELSPRDRVLQFASISFDVAAEELFPTWLAGASLVLRTEQSVASFDDFLRFVREEELTVLNLPTPYWHEWVSELSRTGAPLPPSLRLVVVGSDKALLERLSVWRKLVGDRVRWINAYGPTEATITATAYEPDGDAVVEELS